MVQASLRLPRRGRALLLGARAWVCSHGYFKGMRLCKRRSLAWRLPRWCCLTRAAVPASRNTAGRSGSGLAAFCQGNKHPGLATQRSRIRRGLHPNSTVSPRPKLGPLCTPSDEVRDQWAGKLRVVEASSGSGPALGNYGLEIPEPLDMYRVAALHGFSDPREAVEWCRRERSREAREAQSQREDPLSGLV